MEKQARAKLNQVFICVACARTFLDRACTEPIDVEHEQALHPVAVPHPRYPNDAELAKTTWEAREVVDAEGKPATATVGARPAIECCKQHVRLADSRHLAISKKGDGYELTAARYLEGSAA